MARIGLEIFSGILILTIVQISILQTEAKIRYAILDRLYFDGFYVEGLPQDDVTALQEELGETIALGRIIRARITPALNLLTSRGYELERVEPYKDNDRSSILFILKKEESDG